MMNVKICCHCHFLKEADFNRNFKCLPQHFWEYRIGIHFQWIKNNTVYYFIKTRSDLICLGYSNTTLYKVSVYYLLNITKKKKAKQYNKNKKLTLASLSKKCLSVLYALMEIVCQWLWLYRSFGFVNNYI